MLQIGYMENKTQENKILELLEGGDRVPLPKILNKGIAQYNARIWGLRKKGYKIENRVEYVTFWGRKKRHAFFRLVAN